MCVSFFLLSGLKSFLHLPALQCYSLERWRLLLLRVSYSCHVCHFNRYLTVHNQKSGSGPEFSVTFHPAFLSTWTLLLLLQQYVMLRDMVAAHSVLRVSVCRGNDGGHHESTHSISPDTFFFYGFCLLWYFSQKLNKPCPQSSCLAMSSPFQPMGWWCLAMLCSSRGPVSWMRACWQVVFSCTPSCRKE